MPENHRNRGIVFLRAENPNIPIPPRKPQQACEKVNQVNKAERQQIIQQVMIAS